MSELNEEELNCLTATLWFAHLNREAFYNYVQTHGHDEVVTFMEEMDVNELRRKLSDIM